MTLAEWRRQLQQQLAAQTREDAEFAAEQIIQYSTGLSRLQCWQHSAQPVSDAIVQRGSDMVARLCSGEPLAYVLGEWSFFGLDLAVTADVLIPRADTECLVDYLRQQLPPQARGLDLGCGSGAIAIALAHERPDLTLYACDLSEAAVSLARANAARHRLPIVFFRSDWLQAVAPSARLDFIVSNPPYIEADDPHLAQLQHEPRMALTSGPDGLDAIRDIIRDAPSRLRPGGWLIFEHGYQQGNAVRALLEAQGWQTVQTHCDLAGRERFSVGLRTRLSCHHMT